MALKRRSSMVGIRKQVSQLLGWPSEQLRSIRKQVAERLAASIQAVRAKYVRARAENATKVVEVSPPSASREG
jgi:hypothetical protein